MSDREVAAVLAIWHDVAAGTEKAVRDWYSREHHFERLAIAGFVEARRHEKVEGDGPAIMCLYGVEAISVLDSEAYRSRLSAPSAWTQAVMPYYRNMSRTVCRLASQQGAAEGGFVATAVCAGHQVPSPEDVGAALADLEGVLRWRLIVATADRPTAPGPSAETALRGASDAGIGWAVLVDAHDADAGRAALGRLRGPAGDRRLALYRLAFAARGSL